MKNRLIQGGLALAVYPFIAIPSLMSLAAHTTGREDVLLMVVARSFQIATLIYPLVYIPCLIAAIVIRKRNEVFAVRVASVPLCFLGLLCLLFIGWLALDIYIR
jgi:hypothetical protein